MCIVWGVGKIAAQFGMKGDVFEKDNKTACMGDACITYEIQGIIFTKPDETLPSFVSVFIVCTCNGLLLYTFTCHITSLYVRLDDFCFCSLQLYISKCKDDPH